ncbi:glycosyl hydrolase family 8 [Paenibacillus hexagrammi]|uniref:Glycosyl hydrolase family 8 n=1 Tax=Paenibacillus hexagrammi TaxID=2908839 RepID=A0ABY3SLN4_9BACL|nr:glycosyl hydrolase family 8 [Paenibacillus sp. YPD9-1]UJF34972.1 glycosyl hydrolase family 8 [Paenibacillus sp. YPD9-1]
MKNLTQGAVETGVYRNLFVEYGYSEEEVKQRVEDAFQQIFYGDEDTKIFYDAGDAGAYFMDTGNDDVRTEGMSYAMMMAVQLDRKDEFDRVWKWAKTNMYMTEGRHAGYFAWSCNLDGSKRAYGPAPDGEEYFAMALFFASHRWGDGDEPYNYSTQAKDLLRDCIHKGEHNDGYPMWNPDNKLIKFVPEVEYSDPSYHLPHFYELFALWAYPEDRDFWKQAAEASRRYLPISCHPETGLAPEYAHYDGTPNNDRGYGHFFSDSYRVAANIGLDAEWYGRSDWHQTIIDNIQRFFADKSPDDYRRYTITGEPFEEKSLHPVGLIATNAMASLATDGPHAKENVDLFWNTPVRTGARRYYDNCLYLFSMLALSGNYRIWMPKETEG